LRTALHLDSVHLLNDLEAIATAVPVLEPSDLHTLRAGTPVPGGTIAVIAPGTGLGEAFLTWDGSRYRAYASEGGHADFAPTNPLQIDLLRYLQERFGHVSYERVCSGIGVPSVYEFLRGGGGPVESPTLRAQLDAAEDVTPLIVTASLDPKAPDPLSVATLELCVSVLGAEAGNLALKVLATGGVYVGGGIPPRILPFLGQDEFLNAFQRKGRMGELLARMPVHVIVSTVALIGAASHGFETTA
jgi:glucokinase